MVSGTTDLPISLINRGELINSLNRRLRACPWYEEFEAIHRNLQLSNIRKVNLSGDIKTDCLMSLTSCLNTRRNRAKAPMTKTRNIHTRAGTGVESMPFLTTHKPCRAEIRETTND